MPTKFFFRIFAAVLLGALFTVVASAQTQRVEGKITLKQADGTTVPVKDAVVDFYRTDISNKFSLKSNAKGEYVHAGLPFGVYTIAISAPGARPSFLAQVKISQRPSTNFTLEPGDGSRLTLEEIKKSAATMTPAGSGGSTARTPVVSKEDKARREEALKKNEEIMAGNKKIEASNEVVARTFKAGNDALTAGRLDEAITFYNEGVAARDDEPALLTNLAEALRSRGVTRYNAAIKAKEPLEPAKKDWTDAAEYSRKAVEITKTAPASTDPAEKANQVANKQAALSTRAYSMRLVATKVDQTQAPAALTAYQELIAAETDPVKKAKYRAESTQMLFDAGAADLAVSEARAMLAENPDNADANRILGLALFSSGDKAKFQEAANYLQRYIDKAPDTDPLKASAKESIEYLKTAENVKPQKLPSAPARTGRRRP